MQFSGLKRKTTPQKVALSPQLEYAYTPNQHPEVLGKQMRMKFKGKFQLYEGVIYIQSWKYGVYSPCDKQTVEIFLDDERPGVGWSFKFIIINVLTSRDGPHARHRRPMGL